MIYLNNNTEVQLVSIPRGTVAASSSVTQYATEEYVDEAIAEAISGITGVNYTAGENIQIINDVISVTGMPDTSEFVTSGEVETQINNAISGITGGTVEYSAGTNIKIEERVISVTGLPTSNTAFTNDANYVNSGEVQTQINDSISGITGGTTSYTAGTNIDITNNVISVTGITVPDVSHFVTSGDVQTQIDDSISGKADTTAITGFVTSAEVQTQIDESISGITGGSGEKVVELTMAEYTALTAYSQDTTYIITDAPAINLDDLATTGDLATKADKVSVTANTSEMKFPTWNNQGVITGCANVTVWVGTQAEYDLIATKNASTIYFVKQS